MSLTFDTETKNIIRCAEPIVVAINALAQAHEDATDILLDDTDEEFDDHPIDTLRYLTYGHMQKLFDNFNALIADKGIQVKFNRIGGTYFLVDK